MPHWTSIEPVWAGEDVFVIGGGPSLKGFDWSRLLLERTIACNGAFKLGSDIVDICIFNDMKFWRAYRNDLADFGGIVCTANRKLRNKADSWLWHLSRKAKGLHTDSIGWNTNTGSVALNLALRLGAGRVILLGFDMKLKDGKNNWHKYGLDGAKAGVMRRIKRSFSSLIPDVQKKWPGVEVLNVNDDSDLEGFPKIGVNEFFNDRRKHDECFGRD